MLEDLSSDISARPVRPHMGHLSRDSYFSRGILPICARDRSFSSAELCHNQTDPLPKGDKKPRDAKKPGCQKWGIDKILACYTAPMVFVVKQRTPLGVREMVSAPQTNGLPEGEDRLQSMYFERALNYHIAARYAVVARLAPVSGNLAHHAIEFYLKGALIKELDQAARRLAAHARRLRR
jgi:hypothetical protein